MKKSTKEDLQALGIIMLFCTIAFVGGMAIGLRVGEQGHINKTNADFEGIELTRFVDKVDSSVDKDKWIETSSLSFGDNVHYSLYSREHWEYFERERWADHNDGPDYGCKKYKITGFRSKERTNLEYDTDWEALEIDEKALHCPKLYEKLNNSFDFDHATSANPTDFYMSANPPTYYYN